jgi:hypothetical protein
VACIAHFASGVNLGELSWPTFVVTLAGSDVASCAFARTAAAANLAA